MATIVKILKNKSGSDLDILNRIIANDGEMTVDSIRYLKLADESCGLHSLILSGDIIVSDGTNDLNPIDGLNWAKMLAFSINDFPFQKLCAGYVDTNRIFCYYDSIGNTDINNGTSVLFNTIRPNSDTAAFSASSGELECKVPGLYWIEYEVSINITTSSRTKSKAVLQVDCGSGFNNVPGTTSWMYHRTSGQGATTGVGSALLDLTSCNKVRVYAERVSGTANCVTEADSSRFTIKPIKPKNAQNAFSIKAGNIANGTTWSNNRIKAGSL